jgi:hypothetical protein
MGFNSAFRGLISLRGDGLNLIYIIIDLLNNLNQHRNLKISELAPIQNGGMFTLGYLP